jgi:hypothetical protein
LQPPDPIQQHRVLLPEVGRCIGLGTGHCVLDLFQTEPELAVEQDALQTLEVAIGVPAIYPASDRPLGVSSPISS